MILVAFFPKDKNIIYWIPIFCRRINRSLRGKAIKEFVETAKKELSKIFVRLHDNAKYTLITEATIEEREAMSKVGIIRNNELICYHMSLKYLREYIDSPSKKNISRALEWYEKGEKNWRVFLDSAKHFTVLNLLARGKVIW